MNSSRQRRRKKDPPDATLGTQEWSLGEFLSSEVIDPKAILAPWLKEGGLWMCYADPGVGKTFFSLSVAFAVASGGKFLNWKAPKPRKVLYIDGEMETYDMHRRLTGIWGAAERDGKCNLKAAGVNFIGWQATYQKPKSPFPDLAHESGRKVLMEKAAHADLIVVDNLTTTMRTGEENEAAYWTPMQDMLVELRKAGKAVILVHHTNKSGEQRGTSSKDIILNGKMKLSRPKDYSADQGARFTIEYEKARGLTGNDSLPIEVRLDEDNKGFPKWEYTVIDSTRHTELMRAAQSGNYTNQTELGKALGVSQGRIAQLRNEAIERGLFTSDLWNRWLRAAQDREGLEVEPVDTTELF